MAKNPLVTKNIKLVIGEIYLKNPTWAAKKIRDAVEAKLHETNPCSQKGWPGLSAVQKEVSVIRRKDDERSPESRALDRPWSIGALNKYDIAYEVVPRLIEINNIMKNIPGLQPLEIRRARWASRLQSLTKDNLKLITLSGVYAERELVSELMGIDLDTSDIDELAIKSPSAALSRLWDESIAHDEERKMGLVLDPPDSTLPDIHSYRLWLGFIGGCKRWPHLAKEQQKALVIGLREWIKGLSQNENQFPYKFVSEVDSELAREMEERYHRAFEEEPDERVNSR
jgi:hypothetical protein